MLVVGQRDGLLDRLEPLGILDIHAFRPFQEGEMVKRGLVERDELDPHTGGVGVGGHREVRTSEARRGADGGQQVLHQREMEHLLLADLEERRAPAPDRVERFRGQPLIDGLLEREGREQVLEHDEVLELCGLAQGVDQRLAVLDAAGARVVRTSANGQDAGERTLGTDREVLDRRRAGLGHVVAPRRP